MKRERKRSGRKSHSGGRRKSKGSLILLIMIVILSVFLAKLLFFPTSVPRPTAPMAAGNPADKGSLDESVFLVASEFRCACGGCGELPLIECECNMPRGAVEEKDFIRTKLAEGMGVDQVIQLMEKTYGHRIS